MGTLSLKAIGTWAFEALRYSGTWALDAFEALSLVDFFLKQERTLISFIIIKKVIKNRKKSFFGKSFEKK